MSEAYCVSCRYKYSPRVSHRSHRHFGFQPHPNVTSFITTISKTTTITTRHLQWTELTPIILCVLGSTSPQSQRETLPLVQPLLPRPTPRHPITVTLSRGWPTMKSSGTWAYLKGLVFMLMHAIILTLSHRSHHRCLPRDMPRICFGDQEAIDHHALLASH